jgi:hypothetical protein
MGFARNIHEESGISHKMRDVGVALANCHVCRDVESQKTSESTDERKADGRD